MVIVEVKTRAADPNDLRPIDAPEVAVGPRKKRTLIAIARTLVRTNGWAGRPIRIDVVAVLMSPDAKPTVRHHVNAVTLDDVR